MKKTTIFFQSSADLTVCFLCPSTTCYSLSFPSSLLSDMLAHPSPFSPLLPLWLVRSLDKEHGWRESKKKQRAGGNKKRGGEGGALAGEQFPFLPHAHSSLCRPLAQWDFIESAQLRKCAVLASRK